MNDSHISGHVASDAPTSPTSRWERALLEKVLLATVQEQRAARRWKIFFRLLFLTITVAMGWRLLTFSNDKVLVRGAHTALVVLDGMLATDQPANADTLNTALKAAFSNKDVVGIILKINSPGGSPVQAGMIHDAIQHLRAQYPKKPIYAVVEDLCASAAYYIAVAADKIFVDKASIVGSIGVRMDSFGFAGLMDKLGIERRLLTAGPDKALSDPFLPWNELHKQHLQKMLDQIHAQFIEVVRQGRGNRLKDTPELFSGLVWTGQQSIELGLADGLGDTAYVAHEILKSDEMVDYSIQENLFNRVSRKVGLLTDAVLSRTSMLNERLQIR